MSDECSTSIKIEPEDSASEESDQVEHLETKPEFINIKIELEDKEKHEDTPPAATATPSNDDEVVKTEFISLCEIKEDPEGNDFIIPDVGGPQGPITSVDGVSEEDLNLNAVERGKHECFACGRRFAFKAHHKTHVILHSRQKLECHICFLRLNNLEDYEGHLVDHMQERKHECDDCGKRFKSTSNLQQHRKIHLEVKPFHCEKCQKQFPVRAHLLKHQRAGGRCRAPTDTPLKCNVCDKMFEKEFLLKSHLRKHDTDRPYQCDICKMYFKYKSALARHIQIHNNDRPYSCVLCNKTFTNAGLLKPHMRKHTGEKPFPCPVCQKNFGHKHNMLRHLTRHEKKKNLVCKICDKVFPKESRLVYHMRSHTNSKPFGCDVCKKKFSHKQNIMRHYEKKHPNVNYVIKITDASVAKTVWEKVQRKLMEDGTE